MIAKSLCGDTVKSPRAKVIRIIRTLFGEAYLRKHAETLKFDIKKSVRVKSLSTESENRKISSETQAKQGTDDDSKYAHILANLRKLIKKYDIEMIREALKQIEDEEEK
ncbi:MAG TPA: hypothetical protein VN368_00660 [Candidatus Methylomirabilis sp.]|nr:hypothetical protein [Candidatus Methylomirabilis sp.]